MLLHPWLEENSDGENEQLNTNPNLDERTTMPIACLEQGWYK